MSYLPSSKFSCYSNCSKDGGYSGYLYSSEGSMSTHDRNAKTSPAYTHTCKQRQTLRNSTTIHKTANKTTLRQLYALQRSRGYKERLKRSQNAKTRPKTRSRDLSARKTGSSRGSVQKPGVYVQNQNVLGADVQKDLNWKAGSISRKLRGVRAKFWVDLELILNWLGRRVDFKEAQGLFSKVSRQNRYARIRDIRS